MQQKYFFLFIIILFQSTTSWSQGDSTSTQLSLEKKDTSSLSITPEVKKKGNFISRYFKKDYPSPKKAVVLTAIIPGLGQIYNKRHWYLKLPLVYGAFGGLIYSINFNRTQYLELKKQHRYMVDGLSSTTSIYEGLVSDEVVKNARNQHDKWLQMSYVGIGLAYILTAAEAYTTAHLLSFDVSDDLSMQFKPSFDFNPNYGTIVGFGVNFHIGKKKPIIPKVFFK